MVQMQCVPTIFEEYAEKLFLIDGMILMQQEPHVLQKYLLVKRKSLRS